MKAQVFSDTKCTLGEGAFWHPERKQLFWFDILGQRLLSREGEAEHDWTFDDCVSAAGWVDHQTLVIASARALWRFDIDTGARHKLIDLEADNPRTRSNDGRADPQGGFWIGTMGYNAEAGAGAIYRYYKGELRLLFPKITITNAICFAPDGRMAYFTDTVTGRIMRQRLDAEGWPKDAPEVFVDLSGEDFGPDGAVVDAQGQVWNAQWGGSRVACYAPDGALVDMMDLPTPQVSCPAFGGADMTTLFATTAADGREDDPFSGMTFAAQTPYTGQAEHQIKL